MEPISSSKTIILALIAFSHLVNTKLCYSDFIFKHLLILTFKSVFKGLGRVTENFVIICKRQPYYLFFHIQYLNVVFKSDHH